MHSEEKPILTSHVQQRWQCQRKSSAQEKKLLILMDGTTGIKGPLKSA